MIKDIDIVDLRSFQLILKGFFSESRLIFGNGMFSYVFVMAPSSKPILPLPKSNIAASSEKLQENIQE